MRAIPHLPTAEAEAQRAAVYLAEEQVRGDFPDLFPDKYLALPDARALIERGLAGLADKRPDIILDVKDDHEVSGWADHTAIHLHPRLMAPLTALHEVAHWLDIYTGHGPQFCRDLVDLVTNALGDEAGQMLEATYGELGAAVAPAAVITL